MVSGFSKLSRVLIEEKPIGVFADTTILFSATFPTDLFNAESEQLFDTLAAAAVPTFVSVNVRAEFLENHRRAYIADSLVDFLDDMEADLDGVILLKLQSHRKSHRKKADEERNTKLDVNQIKMFRSLLMTFPWKNGNGWDLLCRNYLKPQLTPEWDDAERELALNFISTRAADKSPFLSELPNWERAVELMGDYGISSADAMILNMFLCSKIPILVTADLEMADCAMRESKDTKKVFVPDSALRL